MSINKIRNKMEVSRGDAEYKIVVTSVKTGEVVYDGVSMGGVFASVEELLSEDENTIEGHHQIMGWGRIPLQLYAIDQIRQYYAKNLSKLLSKIREVDDKAEEVEDLERWFEL